MWQLLKKNRVNIVYFDFEQLHCDWHESILNKHLGFTKKWLQKERQIQ